MSDVGLFSIFRISQRALNTQMRKLKVISENIANAEKSPSPTGEVYKRKVVVDQSASRENRPNFDRQLNLSLRRLHGQHLSGCRERTSVTPKYSNDPIQVREIDGNKLLYNPTHPLADASGYVKMPNVNVVEEMIDLMSASRAYDANISVMDAVKNLAKHSMKI